MSSEDLFKNSKRKMVFENSLIRNQIQIHIAYFQFGFVGFRVSSEIKELEKIKIMTFFWAIAIRCDGTGAFREFKVHDQETRIKRD